MICAGLHLLSLIYYFIINRRDKNKTDNIEQSGGLLGMSSLSESKEKARDFLSSKKEKASGWFSNKKEGISESYQNLKNLKSLKKENISASFKRILKIIFHLVLLSIHIYLTMNYSESVRDILFHMNIMDNVTS